MPKGIYDRDKAMHVFSDKYVQEQFVLWYAAGSPKEIKRILEIIQPDEDGIIPNKIQIRSWLVNNWGPHAEALNVQSEQEVELQLIEQRKEILVRQANEGKTLQEKGMKYLQDKDFKNAGEALRAVIMGAALESKASGIDLFMGILGKNDKELLQYIKEQQTKSKGDNMDEQFEDSSEDIDATSTDEGND